MFGFMSNDPYIYALRTIGYNIIRLPKANVRPLQVLIKNGKDLQKGGELETVFKAGENVPVPKIQNDLPAADISGHKSGELRIGAGLSMLGSMVTAIGGSTLGLDVKYQQAKTVSFQYENVLEDTTEIALLDQFLTDADINPFSTHVSELIESDDVYVTTSTIKSNKFTVYPKASTDNEIGLDVTAIQGVVGSNVKVSYRGQNSSILTFEGTTPLVFGFQAVQLFYDRGYYTRFKPIKSDVVMRGGAKKQAVKPISDSTFIRLVGVD